MNPIGSWDRILLDPISGIRWYPVVGRCWLSSAINWIPSVGSSGPSAVGCRRDRQGPDRIPSEGFDLGNLDFGAEKSDRNLLEM